MGWKNKNAKSVIGKKIGERDFGNKNGKRNWDTRVLKVKSCNACYEVGVINVSLSIRQN